MATPAYMRDTDFAAYKDKTDLTDYEAACLLARVRPNADMTQSDMDAVNRTMEFLIQVEIFYEDCPDKDLFLRIVSNFPDQAAHDAAVLAARDA